MAGGWAATGEATFREWPHPSCVTRNGYCEPCAPWFWLTRLDTALNKGVVSFPQRQLSS